MYVAQKKFADGKDKNGGIKWVDKGQVYDGPRAKEFLAKGMIAEQKKLDLEEASVIEKKIIARKAELSALEARLKELRGKVAELEQKASAKPENGKKA